MATILVVDDSPVIRLLVAAALAQIDLTVAQAANGSEALALCEQAAFDVVLLDVEMPGESGLAICTTLKAVPQTAQIPVVLMSGYAPDEIAQYHTADPDFFLAKPFTLDEVQDVVRQALSHAHS